MRVALTPEQCKFVMDKYPFIEIVVRKSEHRCYSDDNYRSIGIEVVDKIAAVQTTAVMGYQDVPTDTIKIISAEVLD